MIQQLTILSKESLPRDVILNTISPQNEFRNLIQVKNIRDGATGGSVHLYMVPPDFPISLRMRSN
jgi:hypothetical protein